MSLEELIKACAERGDAADWEEFVLRFHGLIAAIVLRTTAHWKNQSPALVDDLIQETYLKICCDRKRVLGEFKPHHPESFYGYLKTITVNVVLDYSRAQRSQKRGQGQPEESIDEEFVLARVVVTNDATDEANRNIMLQEIDCALVAGLAEEETAERDRSIFWLKHHVGLSAAEIARQPFELTVKGVESVLHRLKMMVVERLTGSAGKVN